MKEKKIIALMVFSSVISGAESVVIRMLETISKDDFDIYIITNSEIEKNFHLPNIKVLDVGELYNHRIIRRGLSKVLGEEVSLKIQMITIIKKVEKFIKTYGITLVHSNLLNDHYVNSKIKNDVIKIMTIHGAHGLDSATSLNFSTKSIKKIYSTANKIPSACIYFHNLLKNIGIDESKFVIIPNGINDDLINSKKTPEIQNDDLNMVYLGGTRSVKGWDILLKALKLVVDNGYTSIRLDVLRDVSKESAFYQYLEKENLLSYVNFSGYVGNNDHLKHMSQSNLYLLPSYSEGIANTLTEAIGLDKPILATNVGGTPELVQHLKNGYLCDTTAESIANGIIFFLENHDKLKEFSEYNRQIKSNYTWSKIIKLYEKTYIESEKY